MPLQDLSRLSVEASQLRLAVEEARAAAEEGRKGRAALQVGYTWLTESRLAFRPEPVELD